MLSQRHYFHSCLSQLWPCQMWGKLPEASYRNQPCRSCQPLAMQTRDTEFFGRLEGERRKIPISGMESEEPDPRRGLGKPHGAPLFMPNFLNTLINLLQSSSELLLSILCLPKAGDRVPAEPSWLCEDSADPRDGKFLLQQHLPGWHGLATGLSAAAGESSGAGKQRVSCLCWAELNSLMLCLNPVCSRIAWGDCAAPRAAALEPGMCLSSPGRAVQKLHRPASLLDLYHFVSLFLHLNFKHLLWGSAALVVSQVFLPKHMFPKASILGFLCSELLPLPCHKCREKLQNPTKQSSLPSPHASGLTPWIIYIKWFNSEVTYL